MFLFVSWQPHLSLSTSQDVERSKCTCVKCTNLAFKIEGLADCKSKIPTFSAFQEELKKRLINAGVGPDSFVDNDRNKTAILNERNLRKASMCPVTTSHRYGNPNCLDKTCDKCGFDWIIKSLCPDLPEFQQSSAQETGALDSKTIVVSCELNFSSCKYPQLLSSR